MSRQGSLDIPLRGLDGVLQEHWQKVRAAEGWNGAAGDGGANVLRVIGHAAARFPASEAASLCKDLLKVIPTLCMQVLHVQPHPVVSHDWPLLQCFTLWSSHRPRYFMILEAA